MGAGQFVVDRRLNLGLRARVIPDARFVEHALEVAERRIIGPDHCAQRGALRRIAARRLVDGQRGFQAAVQVEAPGRAVIGGGGMMPDVICDRRHAIDRVIRPGGHVLKIGGQDVIGVVDNQHPVGVDARSFGFGRAVGDQRDGVGNSAVSGRVWRARTCASEPRLDGELRQVERGRVAKSNVGGGAAEVKAIARRGSGRRAGDIAEARCTAAIFGVGAVTIGGCGGKPAIVEYAHVRTNRSDRRKGRAVVARALNRETGLVVGVVLPL